MRHLVAVLLVVVGIIHLLPLSGVIGAGRVAALYGVDVAGPDLAILLRHRAVLFGLLGAFLIVAAFRPAWRGAALVAGFVSVVSFLALAAMVGDYNARIGRVVLADWIALGCLLVATGAHLRARHLRRGPADP